MVRPPADGEGNFPPPFRPRPGPPGPANQSSWWRKQGKKSAEVGKKAARHVARQGAEKATEFVAGAAMGAGQQATEGLFEFMKSIPINLVSTSTVCDLGEKLIGACIDRVDDLGQIGSDFQIKIRRVRKSQRRGAEEVLEAVARLAAELVEKVETNPRGPGDPMSPLVVAAINKLRSRLADLGKPSSPRN